MDTTQLDQAYSFKQWLSDLVHLKNHVTIAGLIVSAVGIFLIIHGYLTRDLSVTIAGIIAIISGVGVIADEAAHLLTN